MSLKKTWFSYMLWFVFTVAAIVVSYNILGDVLQEFYAMLSSYAPQYSFVIDLGGKVLTIAAVIFLVVLLQFLCGKIKSPVVPAWLRIIGHIVLGVGIVAVFGALRYSAFMQAYLMEISSAETSLQAQFFFELSKVGSMKEGMQAVGTLSVLEQGYISVLHTIFLFVGNKIGVLYWTQLIAQSLIFIFLIFIGWTMQKGVFAWLPALLYAVMPSFFYSASDVGFANFWILIAVFCLFVICLLEKAWKKKQITYLVMVFAQVLAAGFVFWAKTGVLIYSQSPFISGGITPGAEVVLNWEMLIWTAFLMIYSVTFFMDKQDMGVLFSIPFAAFGILFAWLSAYEYESSYFLMMLALLNLIFLISESARAIFRTKPLAVTDTCNSVESVESVEMYETDEPAKQVESNFEWEEMKEVMHSTEGIEVREEEPVKVELPITEIPIDRKAPIENVLPMPKKHKPRVFDYAFEPTEDMMHYDVELENDEYDY